MERMLDPMIRCNRDAMAIAVGKRSATVSKSLSFRDLWKQASPGKRTFAGRRKKLLTGSVPSFRSREAGGGCRIWQGQPASRSSRASRASAHAAMVSSRVARAARSSWFRRPASTALSGLPSYKPGWARAASRFATSDSTS